MEDFLTSFNGLRTSCNECAVAAFLKQTNKSPRIISSLNFKDDMIYLYMCLYLKETCTSSQRDGQIQPSYMWNQRNPLEPVWSLNLSTGERFVSSGHDEGPHRGGVVILMSRPYLKKAFLFSSYIF